MLATSHQTRMRPRLDEYRQCDACTAAINRTQNTTVREAHMRCLIKKDHRILVLGQAFHYGRKTNLALKIAKKSTSRNAECGQSF